MGLLLILALLLKLPLFLYPSTVVASHYDGRLYHLVITWVNKTDILFLPGILALMLLYVQALMITSLVNEYRMTNRQSFLPGMAYMLITSLQPEWNYLSAPLVATTFVIWSFSQLFGLYNDSNANGKIFNIGLLIGIASFFYFPSVVFSLALVTGLMILRPFRLNELFLFLLGIITPYYFYVVYLFLIDKLLIRQVVPLVNFNIPHLKNSIWIVFGTLFLTVPFLAGGFYIQSNLRKMLIQARKTWSIILIYLLVALFLPIINSGNDFRNWILCVAPFAAFHAAGYLYPPRKWVSSLLFFLFIAFILFQQYSSNNWH